MFVNWATGFTTELLSKVPFSGLPPCAENLTNNLGYPPVFFLPLPLLWRLKSLERKERIALACAFLLGIVTITVSIARRVVLNWSIYAYETCKSATHKRAREQYRAVTGSMLTLDTGRHPRGRRDRNAGYSDLPPHVAAAARQGSRPLPGSTKASTPRRGPRRQPEQELSEQRTFRGSSGNVHGKASENWGIPRRGC